MQGAVFNNVITHYLISPYSVDPNWCYFDLVWAGVKRAGVKRAGVKRAGVKRASVKRAGVRRATNFI